jgi:hypothetical protein
MVDKAATDVFSREGLSGWFELGAKTISILIGFTYLVGFFVAVWHLSRYGVSSISLLHLQYLVAGLWVVLPPTVAAFLMLTKELPTIHLDRRVPRTPWIARFAVNLFTTLPATIVFGLFLGFLTIHLTTRQLLIALFLLVVIGFSISFFISSLRIPPGTVARLISKSLAPFYAGVAATVVGFYVWFFAMNIYPAIPYEWGGGKPLDVIFLLGDKAFP